MNKVDDWLRAYGYRADEPRKRVAVSPRALKNPRRPLWLMTMLRKLRRIM
jgi:hypothetical protein